MGKFIAGIILFILVVGGVYFYDDISTQVNTPMTATQMSCRGNPRDVDEDNDGLLDEYERALGTSVNVPDSDFDGYNDCKEVVDLNFVPEDDNYAFNPRIADIPSFGVEVTSEPIIEIMWSDSSIETVTIGEETTTQETFGSARSNGGQNSTVTEQSHMAGAEASIGFEGPVPTGSLTAKYEYTNTTSNESTSTFDVTTSNERATAISKINQTETQSGREATNATIRLTVDIVNNGDIAASVSNVSLSAYTIDPITSDIIPVSNLEFEGEWTTQTIEPGKRLEGLVFWTDKISVSTAKRLIADTGGLIITAPTLELLDKEGKAFAHDMTQIGQRTARIIIDYGSGAPDTLDGTFEEYRVAVATGASGGLSITDIMKDILQLDYQAGSWDWSTSEGGTLSPVGPGLNNISGIGASSVDAAYWIVAHSRSVGRGRGTTTDIYNVFQNGPFDFEAISVRPGDVLHLVRVSDKDRDGLSERYEALYGSDPENADTDGDGLTDMEEVVGWNIMRGNQQIHVQSSPTSEDTDRDNYTDKQEYDMRAQGSHPGELNNLPPKMTSLTVRVDGALPEVQVGYDDGDPNRTADKVAKVSVTWSGLEQTSSVAPMKKSGSITIGPPQNAVYNRLGNYNVTVTLEDLEGKTLVHTKPFKLEAPAQKIVANFELDTNEAGTNKVKEKVSGKNATFSLVSSQGRLKNSQVFRAGAVRKAASLEWDGSEKGIIVAPHIPFGTNGQFTMTGWLQLNDIQNNRLFGQDEWFGFTMRDGDLYFGQADTNAGDTSAVQGAKSVKSTDVTFKAGNWYFVAGIANGEELQLYVVDKANVTKPEKFTQSVSGSSINPGRCVFVIGGQIDSNCKGYTYDDQSNGHTGTFDEIRLYDRALSEGEIRALALMGA